MANRRSPAPEKPPCPTPPPAPPPLPPCAAWRGLSNCQVDTSCLRPPPPRIEPGGGGGSRSADPVVFRLQGSGFRAQGSSAPYTLHVNPSPHTLHPKPDPWNRHLWESSHPHYVSLKWAGRSHHRRQIYALCCPCLCRPRRPPPLEQLLAASGAPRRWGSGVGSARVARISVTALQGGRGWCGGGREVGGWDEGGGRGCLSGPLVAGMIHLLTYTIRCRCQ